MKTILNNNIFYVYRFIGKFLPVVQKWYKDLELINNILNVWILVQIKWMYLEEIFLDNKFRQQLPEESKQFDILNDIFKLIIKNTKKDRKIMLLSNKPELLNDLNKLLEDFEACQKLLKKYLDSKRNYFPRFYFLSDNELLSILGNTHNPECIQEHIVKMFDNVGSLSFTNNIHSVNAMISCEKEIMDFKNNVLVGGPIEYWMDKVLKEMWISNQYLVKKSIFDYGNTKKSRCEWMLDYQGQMCLAANGAWWTAEVEHVFIQFDEVYLIEITYLL